MMGAACLALLLGSCVKDDESQSVTNIRDAKTEQLKSVAALNNATAEATKKLAEAEAALKLAQAKAAEADAALTAARAKAAEIEAQLKEVELEAARAELEALKAQYAAEIAMYESQKAQYLAQMEQAAVIAEKALIEAQEALAKAERQYQQTLDGFAAADAAMFQTLYSEYKDAVLTLIQAQKTLANDKIQLAQAETNLVNAEESLEALLASYDERIADYERQIAQAEAKIVIYEKYQTISPAEAQAAYDEQNLVVMDLEKIRDEKTDERNVINTEINKIGYPYNNAFYSRVSNSQLLPGMVEEPIDAEGKVNYGFTNTTNWYGYWVENDDPATLNTVEREFIPLYTANSGRELQNPNSAWLSGNHVIYADPSPYVEYKLTEDQVLPSKYYYDEVISLGEFNEEAVAEYIKWYKENFAENAAANIENNQNWYDDAVKYRDSWKVAMNEMAALKEVNDAYQAAYANANSYDVYNDETGEWELTAYGTAQDAQRVVNNAKNDAENKKAASEAAAEAKKSAEESLKSAKTAQAEADKALAAADKAVADAGKDATDEQKQAAADAKAAAEAAAETVAYWTEQVEETTEKATWAAVDLKEAEAALKEAEAALKEAEAAVEPARDALEIAQRACEKAMKEAGYTVNNWSDVDGLYNVCENNYNYYVGEAERAATELAKWQDYAAKGADATVAQMEQTLAEVTTLKEAAADYIEEYNALQKEYAEAYVAWAIANNDVSLAIAERSALNTILNDANSVERDITSQKNLIKNLESSIKTQESNKVAAQNNIDSKEALVEEWTKKVELDEMWVELCQADADAKKAALEAATATPAE